MAYDPEKPIIQVNGSTTPAKTSLATPDIATQSYSLNGQMYDIELYIDNGASKYVIAPTAIVALSIEETLANWITQGTLTVFYANELAEFLGGFVFRNDGRDLLRMRIKPRDLAINGLPSLDIDKNKKIWELNFLFSIYDVEDVTPQTSSNGLSEVLKKYKKFYFWDLRYQIMLTNNLEYSTALSTSNRKPQPPTPLDALRDEYRSVPADVAMYEIIKQALNNDELLSKTALDVNYEDWDLSENNIFYTSGAQDNSFEDLMYVYRRHITSHKLNGVDSARDFCILNIERGDGDLGYFSLKPLSKYFEKAGVDSPGEYQIEHFFLQNDSNPEEGGIGLYRAPLNLNTNNRDISLRDYSTIVKYEFVDIAPLINASVFATTPVYSFDFNNRTFNVEFQNNSIETAEQVFTENYISQLYKKGGKSNFLLQNQTEAKQKGINNTINPSFSLYGDSDKPELRNPDGLHRLLHTGLFQNTCINFTVPGLTIREPGRFIAIDRPEGSKNSTFDDKLCGQWFVINVNHTIANGTYYNTIAAVKIHRFKELTIEQKTLQNALYPGTARYNQ